MSLAAGFLEGLAGGVTARRERENRQRALSLMEASQENPGQRRGMSLPLDIMGDDAPVARPPRGGGGARSTEWMNDPEIVRGITETADELGMSPEDLATIISYETGGTFNPSQRGPRTQWGQHRGFIQFGEPQARQHGVDWNDPVRSQLGRDGAIVRYYRAHGWKPGMDFLDAYSVVNAGGPGLHHRIDANNGGAPGTVADKVRDQMHGHRATAQAILARHSPAPARPAPDASPRPTSGNPTTNTWAFMRQLRQGASQ